MAKNATKRTISTDRPTRIPRPLPTWEMVYSWLEELCQHPQVVKYRFGVKIKAQDVQVYRVSPRDIAAHFFMPSLLRTVPYYLLYTQEIRQAIRDYGNDQLKWFIDEYR